MSTTRSSSTPSTRPPESRLISATLEVAFAADLLARLYPNGKLGGLTLDGVPPGAMGDVVTLTVKVQRPQRDFTVRCQLAWARHRGNRNLKECYGADFIGDHERLLAFAKHELDPSALRNSPRLMTDLPVRITHQGQTRREFLVDLSEGGAFVRSAEPPDVGHEVELHLKPPRALLGGFSLKGRVAWQRLTGQATGFGVMFVELDGVRSKLERLLEQLSQN